MIQLNLLPDVKMEYIKARRTKRLVYVSAGLVSGIAITVMVVLFLGVAVFQKKHLSDLNRDVKADISTLQGTPDLNKILTIQNQLNSLSSLHGKKHVATRFFGFINQVTPKSITINTVNLDFKNNSLTLGGDGPDVITVNKFVDTLKFTLLKDPDTSVSRNAFNTVVLSSFGLGTGEGAAKKASYQIAFKFDPALFDITKNITSLDVPKQITTRSETEKPSLFGATTSNDNSGTR